MPVPPFLQIQNLTKSFGPKKVLDGVSFTVQQGEILGLLGPNGAGKSTVMKLLVGLIKPDQGNVLCEGNPIWQQMNTFRQRCGMLIERPALFPYLSAMKNLSLAASYSGIQPNFSFAFEASPISKSTSVGL